MSFKEFFFTFILLVAAELLQAQNVNDSQILKLETHPTDSAKFIAKLYNNKTGKLEEYWEMITHVPEISIADFDKQVQQREIEPNGKFYLFYENRAKKLEVNYVLGVEMGEIKSYYETGELRFQGNNKYDLEGKLTHYFKDGSIKKEEIFSNGLPIGKSICYYPMGNIYMETNFNYGQKDGKQIIYYPNGDPKREMKYKMNKLVSEKCFDINGTKTECIALNTEPALVNGKKQFLAKIQEFTFNNENTLEDTLLLTISLKINTNKNTKITSFYFIGMDSLQTDFINWIEKSGIFTAPTFDDLPQECTIHLILPVFQNKIVMSDYYDKWHISYRNRITQEDEETYYWKFSSEDDKTRYTVGEDSTTFFIVEKMPEFPGGEMELRKFIANNIHYPLFAQENGLQGKVYVTFVIDQNGYPVDIKTARGIHPVLDEEAERVVSLMPKWIPAMQRGKPVRVSYTVPVSFVLKSKIGK